MSTSFMARGDSAEVVRNIDRARHRWGALALLAALVATSSDVSSAPIGAGITYQGELKSGGNLVTGLHDMQFCLMTQPTGGTIVNFCPLRPDVPVSDGRFTVNLDFTEGGALPNPFIGEQLWLEVLVRNAAGTFETLNPRQAITVVPEAQRASLASAAPWSGLTGVPAGFQDGVDNTGGGVTNIATGFGLTGGPITGSGTLAVNDSSIQVRITGQCQEDEKLLSVNQNGTVVCESDQTGPGGTVTSVASGNGLTGGPITDEGALAVDFTKVQARIDTACPAGSYVRSISAAGAVTCEVVSLKPILTTSNFAAGVQHSSVAVDAAGNPVVAIFNGAANGLRVLKCSDPACSGPVTLNTVESGDVGRFNSIAVPTDGLPVISYQQNVGGGALKVAKCSTPDCSGTATLTLPEGATFGHGLGTSIAVDATGPVITHLTTTGQVRYVRCSTPNCSTVITAINLAAGSAADVAIVGTRPVIAYRNSATATVRAIECTNFTCATVADSLISLGADGTPSVAANSSNQLAIAFVSNAGDLTLGRCTAGGATKCGTVGTQVVEGNALVSPSLAIDGSNRPVMAFEATDGLRIAVCNDITCGSVNTTKISVAPATSPSLAIASDSLPVVSFTSASALRLGKCRTTSCSF